MATEAIPKPSFSPWRKWNIGFHVVLRLLLVLSVVVMLNYLSRDFFHRFQLSTQTKIDLSPLSLKLIESVTNRVQVTVFYDKSDPIYTTITELLNQYHFANSKITVETVDYLRDPGAAQKIKAAYKLGAATDKNLVIFESEGRHFTLEGNALVDVRLEQVPNEKETEIRRRPVAFRGEMLFTRVLFALTNPKQLKAFCLQGHGEHDMRSADDPSGYAKFTSVLEQNYVSVAPLLLLGTNSIPTDCSLLIIPGPRQPLFDVEVEKIAQYLDQGGRLLALFNADGAGKATGLEKIMRDWGVAISTFIVKDPDNTTMGSDVVVSAFSKNHPLVNPLLGFAVQLFSPRAVGKVNRGTSSADAPRVDEIAKTGRNAFSESHPTRPRQQFPLAVAVEKGAIKGVVTERGSTRMVVVGDSMFLANHQIESAANRDFASAAVSWLLDRPQLLEGIGPRPVVEYRLLMTEAQLRTARWLLLAAMPGAILLFGALVWFRRRK